MPPATKIKWAQLRVGITAVVALVLVGLLIYLLTGTTSMFTHKVKLYTFLSDAAAVSIGAPVRINGIRAGDVENVALTGETAPDRIVRVEMSITGSMLPQIPVDSVATISAENLLGSKFINIKKGKSRETIKPGATIPSVSSKEIFEIMDSFFPLLTSAQNTLTRIDNIVGMVESGKGNIGKLLVDETLYRRMDSILSEFQKTSVAVNSGQGSISKFLYDDTFYNELRLPIQRIDRVVASIEEGKGTAGKFLKDPAVYDELQKNLIVMRAVLADIQAGKGTAGKLLKSDELHNQIAATLKKVDGTVDKLNSGQGTLGQLLVNPQLYESVHSLTREMNGLMKDFRANPKKFLRIKLGLF
ncbi:MAG TPA: MlaD family protein [Bryobacteraceae bacterium]|nr:MlaD family protein [Bryobacteraceae bacterium]